MKELRLEAAIPARQRLAERTVIRLRELESEKFIGYCEEKFPGRNQTITKACTSAGFQPTLAVKANSLVEVLGMIGAGVGVCLMPSDVRNLPHPNVVFVPLNDALEPIRLAAAWLHDNRNSALLSMLGYLKD